MRARLSENLFLIPGNAAYLFLLAATLLWAYWGVGEIFHEGWYPPYTQIIFYFIPFMALLGIMSLSIYLPLAGGILVTAGGIFYIAMTVIQSARQHTNLLSSFWMAAAVIVIPGVLFIFDHALKKRKKYREDKKTLFKKRWKMVSAVVLSLVLIVSIGTPLAVRNLGRKPLDSHDEVTVEGNEISFTLAGEGPGWYYSNENPIEFMGRQYKAFSWNEIALFGMDPVGFEGKRYGPDYDGTEGSIYYATQEDFDRYNMFRYINCQGDQLLTEIQDYWRLPTAEEYVRLSAYRDKNCGGHFDDGKGEAYYTMTPDKDAPLWDPEGMVIYYWTSTYADKTHSYDITYSGEVRDISKITKQDYRGWRAVRTSLLDLAGFEDKRAGWRTGAYLAFNSEFYTVPEFVRPNAVFRIAYPAAYFF